jgi:hypothetical protein
VALAALGEEILARWPGTAVQPDEADDFWRGLAEFRWAHAGGALVKVALTPVQLEAFAAIVRGVAGARGWIGAGGNTGYLSLPASAALPTLAWPAVTLRGEGPLWPGARPRFEVMRAVKLALDPQNRFPDLDDDVGQV